MGGHAQYRVKKSICRIWGDNPQRGEIHQTGLKTPLKTKINEIFS